MNVMFANLRSSQNNNGYLVEFKAGRSSLQVGSSTEKRKVIADKTKGLVFIKQSSDQLMHFCWKNRETGAVVDDLIIFPGDTEFVRVKECTDGRVYMLKFKSTDERRLFWMQDGSTDKDEEHCKKVNDTLNNPPAQRQTARSGTERSGASGFGNLAALSGNTSDADLGALSNLDQSQLMQLLSFMNQTGSGAPADPTSLIPQLPATSDSTRTAPTSDSDAMTTQVATPSNTPANGSIAGTASDSAAQLSQLKDIIASINSDVATRKRVQVDLSEVLCGDNVIQSVRTNASRLIEYIPNQEPLCSNQEELEHTVRTPQFRQAVDYFGHALQTGQLALLLQQFGMTAEVTAAAQSGDLLAFAQKLTEAECDLPKSGTSTESNVKNQPLSQPTPASSEINAEIAKQAAAEETNESAVRAAKKEDKPGDDNMDLD